MSRVTDFDQVVEDVQGLFVSSEHWVYQGTGTPSLISPGSVYHLKQIQVLFEDRYFHDRTYRALQELIKQGFLTPREMTLGSISTTLLWRSNIRWVERAVKVHINLMSEYCSPIMTKATGDYAESLVLIGLLRSGLSLISQHANSYRDKVWTDTEHDLDFVMERQGIGYGIEVKNTLDYFPDEELTIKLEMCKDLGLVPLFIVRHRYSNQWYQTKSFGGLLYIFKSKIFPPGQDALVQNLWQNMRLPVAIWNDWPGQFYPSIQDFLLKH